MKFSAAVLISSAFALLDGPMQVCQGSSTTFNVTNVVLEPYPLRTGSNLVVKTTGLLSTPLTQGSKMTLVAKLGFLKIIDESYDLCTMYSAQGGCPIDVGMRTINFERMISDKYPNANVNMEMKVLDSEGKEALCMTGKLQILKGGE